MEEPSAAQKRLIRQSLGDEEAVVTIDSYQGNEADIICLDIGRNEGIGFLFDPRRVNVALTRAKKLLVILLNSSIGLRNAGGSGQRYWQNLRQVFYNCNCLWHIGRIVNPGLQAEEIVTYLRGAPALQSDAVEKAFAGKQQFFDKYMFRVAGSILNAGLIEDSDDDVVAEPYRNQELLKEADEELWKEAEEEAGDAQALYDADLEQEEMEVDLVSLPAVAQAALAMRPLCAESQGGTFCIVLVTSIEKLLVASTFGNPELHAQATEDRRGDVAFRRARQKQCRDLCIDALAWLLHLSLRHVYGDPHDEGEQDSFAYTFHYPEGLSSSLASLASGHDACLNFLQSLWNCTGDADGSALFYQYQGFDGNRTSSQYVAGAKYQIVLPYSIVAALTSEAACTHETRGQGTRYDINIPVWSSRHGWLGSLKEGLREEILSGVETGKGKRTLEDVGENTLKIKPLSVRKEYRRGDRQISQALSDLCLPFASVYDTAVEKENWWYADFSSILEGRGSL